MPRGTRAVFTAEISAASAGKTTKLRRALSVCDSAGNCERIDGATITYTYQGELMVGEVAFVQKGMARRIPFRALDCPVAHSDRMVCG
jgi:hypothetical protein